MTPRQMGTSRRHWFFRGMLMGVMFVVAINALSYFYHSSGWGSLLGGHPASEGIGVPLLIWDGAAHVDRSAMRINIAVSLLFGAFCGLVTITQTSWLNTMVEDFQMVSQARTYHPFQFSIGNMLIATVPIAVLFAAAKTGRTEVLAAIYVAGPASLVVLAMLPKGLSWDWRVIILTPMALSLIVFAVWIATRLDIPFDRVLLGVYVCWVPQSAIAAIAMTLAILLQQYRRISAGIAMDDITD